MKKIVTCTFLAVFILMVSISHFAAAEIVLKGGHTGTPTTMLHKTLERWANTVKEKTNGEVIIEVYPSEQLGDERTLLENSNLGTVDWCDVGSGGAARFVPAFGIFENAYTFKNVKHFENVAFNADFMMKLAKALEEKSELTLLGFTWLGNRSLLTKKPVKSPEDAQGMKLRVPDVPTYKVVAYAVGAIATPLPFGEAYMALKQGVVDAVEGTPESMIKMRFCEVAKNYTLTNHLIQAGAIYMNKGVFYNKLSAEQQKIVREAATEACRWFFDSNAEIQKGFLKQLEAEEGVTIIELSSTDAFRTRAFEMLEKQYIPKWGKIWEEFNALAE